MMSFATVLLSADDACARALEAHAYQFTLVGVVDLVRCSVSRNINDRRLALCNRLSTYTALEALFSSHKVGGPRFFRPCSTISQSSPFSLLSSSYSIIQTIFSLRVKECGHRFLAHFTTWASISSSTCSLTYLLLSFRSSCAMSKVQRQPLCLRKGALDSIVKLDDPSVGSLSVISLGRRKLAQI